MDAAFIPTPEMIDAIADWHRRQSDERVRRPLLPVLRDRFGLDNAQAIKVIRASNKGGAYASQ